MDRAEEARLAWQRAQAELQGALARLERLVAGSATPDELVAARADAAGKQKIADDYLHRYITRLGKSRDD